MQCPKCKSNMVQRVARTGVNAGKSFWGCSNYPICKEIVNIDIEDKNDNNEELLIADVYFYTEPLNDDFNVNVYNSIGIDSDLLRYLNNNLNEKINIERHSKFRVDTLNTAERNYFNNNETTIFSLYLRLLTRGKVTLNSHTVENALKNIFNPNFNLFKKELNSLHSYTHIYNNVWNFDSENEKVFYGKMKKLLGYNFNNYIIPQVYLSTLTKDSISSLAGQRVDFLISDGKQSIVIELDGDEHIEKSEHDKIRDNELSKNNIKTIRIPNAKIETLDYIDELRNIIYNIELDRKNLNVTNERRYFVANKIIHQIQISLAKALEQGNISLTSNLKFSFNTDLFTENQKDLIFKLALTDINETINNFFKLYGIKNRCNLSYRKDKENDLVISINEFIENEKLIMISDIYYHNGIKTEIEAMDSIEEIYPEEKIILYFLAYIYRFNTFKDGQLNSIVRTLQKKDSIVLLPTGAGKSLIFQLSSMLLSGLTIVIDPITSLMDDQIDNLKNKGIDNVLAIHSTNKQLSSNKPIDSSVFMIYLSPERLQIKTFREQINGFLINSNVPLIVIDEAHCVSEWGHDFRTAYLNIGNRVRKIFSKMGSKPSILALTGTASTSVLKDVKRELNIEDFEAIITPDTFDRPELKFSIIKTENDTKLSNIEAVISSMLPKKFKINKMNMFKLMNEDTYSGIIFVPFVNGEHGVANISKELSDKLNLKIDIYSGSSPKSIDNKVWNKIKQKNAQDFKNNNSNLLVATKAYGMGIDKPNVRYTIHYGIPNSIESLYQEAGRAGRDRKHSECIILFTSISDIRNDQLLDLTLSIDSLRDKYESIKKYEQDDITRALFFHLNGFLGISKEKNKVKALIEKLFSSDKIEHDVVASKSGNKNDKSEEKNQERLLLEKSIQRLSVLGVISDYFVEYSTGSYRIRLNQFNKELIINNYLNYVRGYNERRVEKERSKLEKLSELDIENFVLNASYILIEFIYDTIEKGRRRGIKEIVQLSKTALKSRNQDSEIRGRIVRYFESSYSEDIDAILEANDLGLNKIIDIFDGWVNEEGESVGGIYSYKAAEKIRGQVSRYLESTPDHPGLLILRSLSECYSHNYNYSIMIEDLKNAILFGKDRYSASENELMSFIKYYLGKSSEIKRVLFEKVYADILDMFDLEKLCSEIINDKSILYNLKKNVIAEYFNIQSNKVLKKIKETKEE